MNEPEKLTEATQIAMDAFKAEAPDVEVLDWRTEFFDDGRQIGSAIFIAVNGAEKRHVRRAKLQSPEMWRGGAAGNGRALATWAKKRLERDGAQYDAKF